MALTAIPRLDGELARAEIGMAPARLVIAAGTAPDPGVRYDVVAACTGTGPSRVMVLVKDARSAGAARDAVAGVTVVCDGQQHRAGVGALEHAVSLELTARGTLRQAFAVLAPVRR